MWDDRAATVLREHPDVIAVYESPRGRLALLLRHTFVPLPDERPAWRHETHAAAWKAVHALRKAGVAGSPLVLQWLPLPRADDILRRWACRYDEDPQRRSALARFVARTLADRSFLVARARMERARQPVREDAPAPIPRLGVPQRTLKRWYQSMAACWLDLEPHVRRDLVLCTHRWIFERVLALPGAGVALADLRRDGALARKLERLVPAEEQHEWERWISLVLADLDRAMRVPAHARDEAWTRWLFLIPYSLPVARVAADAR